MKIVQTFEMKLMQGPKIVSGYRPTKSKQVY